MSQKSQTAQLPIIDANESKHEDCLKIMDHYETVLTQLYNEAHGINNNVTAVPKKTTPPPPKKKGNNNKLEHHPRCILVSQITNCMELKQNLL